MEKTKVLVRLEADVDSKAGMAIGLSGRSTEVTDVAKELAAGR
jgi:hypothetical protein